MDERVEQIMRETGLSKWQAQQVAMVERGEKTDVVRLAQPLDIAPPRGDASLSEREENERMVLKPLVTPKRRVSKIERDEMGRIASIITEEVDE